MSLKTSFFNKTLVKSDFKRLWWIPAVHTISLFLMCVFTFMERYFNSPTTGALMMRFERNCELVYSTLYRYMIPSFVLSLIVPVVLAVFLFSYMQSGKSSTFAHSVPVSRGATFVSHAVSGILMFLIPLIVNGAILLVMRLDSGFAQTFLVSHLMQCLLTSALYSFVAFALATAVAMITGNVVANFVFTYIFSFLPLAAEAFLKFFLYTQLYGNILTSDYWCGKHLYLAPEKALAFGGVALYVILSAALLAVAYLLYRARNMENHSEVVAFPVLRPVFVFSVALCSGAVGFAYVNALWSIENTLSMLPFGLVGLIIATMLVKKSFRGLKLLKPVIIYSLAIVCVFTIFHYDLTGYERRVPTAFEVEHVTFEQNGINPTDSGWYYDDYGKKYKLNEEFSPDITNPEDIKNVCTLHLYLTDEEQVAETLNDPWRLTLRYKLRNGKTLSRQYTVDYTEYKAFLEPIVTTDTVRKTYFPILRDTKRQYTSVSVYDDRIADAATVMFNDEETVNEFLEALKKDTKNAPYDEYAPRGRTYTRIEISYKANATYEDGTPVADENILEKSETYYIRPSYKNTLALIEKYNVLSQLPDVSDIKKIGVEYYGIYGEVMTSSKMIQIEHWEFPVVIENPQEIAEVYEYCKRGGSRNSDMMVMFFLENGHSFSCDLLSTKADLPQCLKTFITP
ncbi:MAG: hypothetical protein IJC10_01875 [Clostridia bacterium]|nr:hypothetical protein [Clostridia bacterium]